MGTGWALGGSHSSYTNLTADHLRFNLQDLENMRVEEAIGNMPLQPGCICGQTGSSVLLFFMFQRAVGKYTAVPDANSLDFVPRFSTFLNVKRFTSGATMVAT